MMYPTPLEAIRATRGLKLRIEGLKFARLALTSAH